MKWSGGVGLLASLVRRNGDVVSSITFRQVEKGCLEAELSIIE